MHNDHHNIPSHLLPQAKDKPASLVYKKDKNKEETYWYMNIKEPRP